MELQVTLPLVCDVIAQQISIVAMIGIVGIMAIGAVTIWNGDRQEAADVVVSEALSNRATETAIQIGMLQAINRHRPKEPNPSRETTH